MKSILSFIVFACSFSAAFSQTFDYADPAVTGPILVDARDSVVDPEKLLIGTRIRLQVGFFNIDPYGAIPRLNTRVQINLGSGLELVKLQNLGDTSLNKVFTWSVETIDGQQVITGIQAGAMSASYFGVAQFQVQVVGLTPPSGSEIATNFIVTNDNPDLQIIFDHRPQNNSTSLTYNTAGTLLPVTLLDFTATADNCTAKMSWKVGEEVNVSHYEVLMNGKAVARVPASGATLYQSNYHLPADVQRQPVAVQLRTVDRDGTFTLSYVRFISGNCDNTGPLVVSVYPNPVTRNGSILIAAKQGSFNGKYRLELLDNAGKRYQVKEVQLDNAVLIPFQFTDHLIPGHYMIRVSTGNRTVVGTVKFIKGG